MAENSSFHPPDDELAASATAEACAALYARHAPALLAFLAARLPSAEFEDVHQEVWLRVWQHLPSGYQGGNFRAWLFRMAHNLCIDLYRRKRPGPLPADDEAGSDGRPDTDPAWAVLQRERHDLLRDCLEALGKRDAVAEALVRGRLGGAGYEELCPRLGLTGPHAHKRWHLAVKQLQDCVGRADR